MQEIKQTAACSTPLHVERTVYEAGLRLCACTAAVGMASLPTLVLYRMVLQVRMLATPDDPAGVASRVGMQAG